jgi:hypothetical protein
VSEVETPSWVRSTACSGGNCVEVAKVADGVLVRDSKNPEAGRLSFTVDEWSAFLHGAANGEFRF